MGIRSTICAIGIASALTGCATHQAPRAQVARADCSGLATDGTLAELYSAGTIKKVEPIYRQQFVARAIQPRYVAGASLYVPAEAGMNEAYLERVLSCHAALGRGEHPNDPLGAEGVVDVDVVAAGPRMRIAITGQDRASGQAIWKRAMALHEQAGEVTIQQLSSAPAPRSAM